MMLSKHEQEAIYRTDFVAFAQGAFYELNPGQSYLHNWHIDSIAEHLEQCRRGTLRNLIINLPPRYLKSHLASISFPAWLFGHDPRARIICASYAEDLADKLGGDCLLLMSSRWYRHLFSNTRLASARPSVHDFATTKKGFRLATSVGGTLEGRGADFIIIDDPLKPDEALSDSQRSAVNDWYEHTLFTRLNNKNSGCFILIMQRLHEDDLVGHLLNQRKWKLLRFPAIAEEDERHIIRMPCGRKTVIRKQGEALHPERESLETLAAIRETMGEYNFAGQYQQSPSPLGGGLVKIEWFKTYTPDDLPKEFELVFQSWDTANKASELSAYSACTTWGLSNRHVYLLNVYRKRLNYPELKRAVREQALNYRVKNVLIEDKASGTQLIQDLIADGVHTVTKYQPRGDKVQRMSLASPMIENGFVHIPTQEHWLPDYLREIELFPAGKFADQVDSTSQALDWVKDQSDCLGLVELLKRMGADAGIHSPNDPVPLNRANRDRLVMSRMTGLRNPWVREQYARRMGLYWQLPK